DGPHAAAPQLLLDAEAPIDHFTAQIPLQTLLHDYGRRSLQGPAALTKCACGCDRVRARPSSPAKEPTTTMSHHPRTPSSTIAFTAAAIALPFTFTLMGCGLFIHSTPISKLPDSDREVIAQSGGKPNAVRLTRPAKVAGFDVAAGSVVQAEG